MCYFFHSIYSGARFKCFVFLNTQVPMFGYNKMDRITTNISKTSIFNSDWKLVISCDINFVMQLLICQHVTKITPTYIEVFVGDGGR